MYQSNNYSKAGTLTGALLFGLPVTFVLRTFGAAGALWGASEVVGLRKTDDTPTQYAAIGLASLSFVLFMSQFLTETPGEGHKNNFKSAFLHAMQNPHQALKDEFSKSKQTPLLDNIQAPPSVFARFLQTAGMLVGTALTIDLEGFGSGGAFWGSSDALWLRGNATEINGTDTPIVPNNSDAWSKIAYGFFFFGFLRLAVKFLSPLVKPIAKDSVLQTLLSPRLPYLRGYPLSYQAFAILMTAVSFVLNLDLDVLGAGASLWGGSYVFEMRDDSNEVPWRTATLAMYAFALVRYLAGFAFSPATDDVRVPSHNPLSMLVRAANGPDAAIKDLRKNCCPVKESTGSNGLFGASVQGQNRNASSQVVPVSPRTSTKSYGSTNNN